MSSHPVSIPSSHGSFNDLSMGAMHDAVEAMGGPLATSRVSAELLRSTREQQKFVLEARNLGKDMSPRHGTPPSSPTARSVWHGVFNPGRNANMRGASRFDNVEPGSPSTWDYVVRAELARSPVGSPGGAVPASTSPRAPAGAVSVDIGKLDALMRQAHKDGDGKLTYADWADVMRLAASSN